MVLLSLQRWKSGPFGVCLLVVLLAPSTHVLPPAWWQGGWRRHHVGNKAQVELLSRLAAVLMPKTPIAELFRSFPAPDGWSEEPLEPDLTAYGVFRDPNAALFVFHDVSHEKREAIERKTEALLTYGPPGSRFLLINHKRSRQLQEEVMCVKLCAWASGDELALSKVLGDLLKQLLLQFGQFLDGGILERVHLGIQRSPLVFAKNGQDFTKIAAMLGSLTISSEIGTYFVSEGFSEASIDRIQKSVRLIGLSTEMRLQSRIQQLLNIGESEAAIAVMITNFAPSLGRNTQQNLNGTARWLLQYGLRDDQVATAILTFPALVSCRIQHSLKPTVRWLLDLDLPQRHVVRAICGPQTSCSTRNLAPTVQWLLDLGLTAEQLVKVFDVVPSLLGGYCPEVDWQPTVQWLLDLGVAQGQVEELVATFPQCLALSLQQNLRPKVQWLIGLGLNRGQIVKTIVRYPPIFACRLDQNLKPKVQWLLDLGLERDKVARTIASYPAILGCSLEQKLEPTAQWLIELGLSKNQAGKVIAQYPSTLRSSVENKLKPTAEWLLELGLSREESAKAIATFPAILSHSLEKKLKPTARWLMELGLSQNQVATVIAKYPSMLRCSIEKNFELTKQWLLELGLTQEQIGKVVVKFPKVLSYSVDMNFKLKVGWLADLGVPQHQLAKVFVSFPAILCCSIGENLNPKLRILQEVFGASGAADLISRRPTVLGYSYQRLCSRLRVLSDRNETMKLASVMDLPEKRFRKRFMIKCASLRHGSMEMPS